MAEMRAYLGLRDFSIIISRSYKKLEAMMPDLIQEMREDIIENQLMRTLLLRYRELSYGGVSEPCLIYYHEDHEQLQGKLKIMRNYRAVIDLSYNDVQKFEFTEDFIDYLTLPVCP